MHETSENKAVCILAMNRSGTSCLAGSLENRGLFFVDVVNYAKHNVKGNKESLDCVAINNDVMALNNGSWDQPPKRLVWNDHLRDRRDAFISSYAARPVWGF